MLLSSSNSDDEDCSIRIKDNKKQKDWLQSEPDPFDLVSLHDDDVTNENEQFEVILSSGSSGITTTTVSDSDQMSEEEQFPTHRHNEHSPEPADDFQRYANWRQAEYERSNQISSQLVQDLIQNSPIDPSNMSIFMDAVYIVEMFNKFVYGIHCDREHLTKLDKIELQPFLRSLEATNEYFETVIRMLFEIVFKDRFPDTAYFNFRLGQIELTELSIERIVYILWHSMGPKAKSLIFENIEEEFRDLESFEDVTVKSRLMFCRNLIDYLCFKVRENFDVRFKGF